MVNAWSLAYDVINGTMDENFPVKKKEEPDDTIVISTGSTDSATFVNFDLNDPNVNIGIDTSNLNFNIDLSTIGVDTGAINLEDVATINWDMDPDLSYMEPGTVLSTEGFDTLNLKIPDEGIPLPQNFLADNDDAADHHFTTPGIAKDCNRKYKEDESIKALQDYISTTYGGHYTSDNNNVQTLDLIESVGDAESFCRSNAIKYLSRYDKKGQAKRDILKALHYSLLLYHFSGQLNETQTRGYETF